MKRWIIALVVGMVWGRMATAQVITPPLAPSQEAETPNLFPPLEAAPRLPAEDWVSACKSRLGQSPIRQIAHNLITPLRVASGGLLPDYLQETPTPADLARMTANYASPAEIVAAKIKVDEANAKARIAAIRFLACKDCDYWHEAEDVLLAALRADRHEAVRFEAARALAYGQGCCTPRTMASLNLVVAGSDADGNPAEKSERVRGVAFAALERYLACLPPPPPVEHLPPPHPFPAPKEFAPEVGRSAPAGNLHQAGFAKPPASTADKETPYLQALRLWTEKAGTPTQPHVRSPRTLWNLLVFSTRPHEMPPPPPHPVPVQAPAPPPPPPPLTPIGQIPPATVSMPLLRTGSHDTPFQPE